MSDINKLKSGNDTELTGWETLEEDAGYNAWDSLAQEGMSLENEPALPKRSQEEIERDLESVADKFVDLGDFLQTGQL